MGLSKKTLSKSIDPNPDAPHRITLAVRDSVLAALVLIGISCLSSLIIYTRTLEIYNGQMREQLLRVAEGAASFVDGDLHETFVSVEQESSDAYKNAVKPLKSLLDSVHGVRYIYTTRMIGDQVYFVLDSVPYGDRDKDGIEDHSPVMQSYDEPDSQMLRVFKEGRPAASEEPYKDQWGVFISAYVPIFNSAGKLVGVLGVDMAAGDFQKKITALQRASISGLVIPVLISVLLGIGVYFYRRRLAILEEQRRQLESQLLQSQKMESVGSLAGGIAHDLNNQLTPLSGYLSMLLRQSSEKDANHEMLQQMSHAARRCAEAVQQLMNFSRPSSKTKTVLETSELLTDFKKSFVNFLPSTIQTSMRLEDGLHRIRGIGSEIENVFLNLMTNAKDAMPEGGSLCIEARNTALDSRQAANGAAGNYVMISFKDSGKGIAEDLQPKIFDPFFTTKKMGHGTGLGLTMVYRIIQGHGGWIRVKSQSGHGSDFQIYLPACMEPKTETPASNDRSIASGAGETILFVDDEAPLRNLGKALLERLGYRVILAEDGEEALSVYGARRSEIAAVVLDMTMPKMTGRQAMKKLLETDPRVKVLLVSGFTSEGSAKELIGEGAKEFLAKPYQIAAFSQALKKVLGS